MSTKRAARIRTLEPYERAVDLHKEAEEVETTLRRHYIIQPVADQRLAALIVGVTSFLKEIALRLEVLESHEHV